MARKKSVRKKSGRASSKRLVRSSKRKIDLVVKNLILFGVLSLISFMLYSVSSNPIYEDTFSLISIILGFVAFAFFIVLCVLLILRAIKK